ncbi:MAG: PDZ domain-containing protein [Gemmataceae bacterium]
MTPTLLALCLLGPAQDLDDVFEKATQAAVKHVSPFVVKIETSGGTEAVSTGGPRPGLVRRGSGPTTGVIVSADGYVISSAFNFANKPTTIRVSLPGTNERKVARVVATDQARMLTLLKLAALPAGVKLPVPVAVKKDEMKVGTTALAIGRTLNAETDDLPSVSVGILSAVERIWGRAVQTDAKVSPTNYGGPLIDLGGRVYGILVPASPQAEGELAGFEWYDSGIGFAVPLEDINAILPRMMKGTEKDPVVLRQGFLGVTMQAGEEMFEKKPVLGTVQPGSPADKAGLKPGDTVVAVEGKEVTNFAQMRHQLGKKYEGDPVAFKILRDGKEVPFEKVILGSGVAAYNQPFLGILPVRDDNEPGVEVRFVYPKSPADAAGIKEGDRVMKVGRADLPPAAPMIPVAGRDGLMDALGVGRPGQDVKVEVKRKAGGKVETLTVKLGELPEAVPDKLPERSTAKKAGLKLGEKPPADGPKKPETGLQKLTLAATGQEYWVYVPENYDPRVSCGVMVWLHPLGKNKERDFEDFSSSWATYCDDHNLILVCPPKDGAWTGVDSDFIVQTVRNVAATYTVDLRRVVAHGMGVGGEMALYLGFKERAVIRGVAPVGAPLAGTVKERITTQPVAFYLMVGDKDRALEAIKDTNDRLKKARYPVTLREIKNMGHEYIDGKLGVPTLEELVRWNDSLDRI